MKTLNDFSMKTKKPWEVEEVEWREVSFNKLISKEKYQVGKVKVRNGLANSGRIPVVDQSRELIRGYLNNEELKYSGPLPVIIFGDHTKIIKFINFHFIVGADGVKILIPNKDIVYPKYFYWLLRKVKLPDRGYARHFKFLKQANYLIPFRNGKPDLETQKKIVEYIEANFLRIDKILEKKKKQLEWLDELWESGLEQAFKPKDGEEWREVRLLDKVNLIKGKKPKKTVKEKIKDALPYLTTEYFRGGVVKEYIPIEENEITLVNEGDLVIIADGSRSGELFFCDTKGVLVSTMTKFEFSDKDLDKKYLFWFLTTHFEHLNKSKYTATPHVNQNYLKNLKISLPFRNNHPDLEKQKEIAKYLDSVYKKIKTLKEKIQNQITQLEEMKESILDEVFNHSGK